VGGKRMQMVVVFAVWAPLLFVFTLIAGWFHVDWLLFVPLFGALIHWIAILARK
jgi:membrane protein YqaA with SNARE-associated domain